MHRPQVQTIFQKMEGFTSACTTPGQARMLLDIASLPLGCYFSSRDSDPEDRVLGVQEIFTIVNPYEKYFLGQDNTPGGLNRARYYFLYRLFGIPAIAVSCGLGCIFALQHRSSVYTRSSIKRIR